MANRRNRTSIVSLLAVGLVPLWLVACGPGESTTGTGGSGTGTGGSSNPQGSGGSSNPQGSGGSSNPQGSGGSSNPQGSGGSGGSNPQGSGGSGGSNPQGAGGSPQGSGGSGGSNPQGSGGSAAGSGGSGGSNPQGGGGRGGAGGATGRGGAAGTGTGGAAGRGGTTGTGGSGTGGTTGTGGSSSTGCPSGTSATYGCGASRTMGFMGCSMSVNVATGYQRDGGMRMWPPVAAYGGQVVQNWTPNSGGPWSAFDSNATMYGKPTDIWMMICIFGSQGVTDAEVQTMIKNARSHSTPNTKIYVTGQPLYEAGHTCTLAGTGGAELTDTRAKAANDPANGVYYAGTFNLDSTMGQVSSDSCHASSPTGENVLGNQFIAKFGK